jgi:hypothetical protein
MLKDKTGRKSYQFKRFVKVKKNSNQKNIDKM